MLYVYGIDFKMMTGFAMCGFFRCTKDLLFVLAKVKRDMRVCFNSMLCAIVRFCYLYRRKAAISMCRRIIIKVWLLIWDDECLHGRWMDNC